MIDKDDIAAVHDLVPAPDDYRPVTGDSVIYESANGAWRRAFITAHDDDSYSAKVGREKFTFKRDQLEPDVGSSAFVAVPLSTIHLLDECGNGAAGAPCGAKQFQHLLVELFKKQPWPEDWDEKKIKAAKSFGKWLHGAATNYL